jgi:hypothetical protein
MRTRQRWIAGFGALWLIGSACAGEHVWSFEEFAALAAGGPCGEVYLEGVADSFRLDADLSTPGSSPEIVFEMFIPGNDDVILLTRRIEITLPAEFGFLGFDAPGGAGAAIGSWDFDYTRPGNGAFDPFGSPADYRIPHIALGPDQAFADTGANDPPAYDPGIDSTAVHALGPGGEHVFTIEMPSGGTNNNGMGGNCSYFDADTRFRLVSGIVVLPDEPGDYEVTIKATSVDPDTGDDDDGQGTPPKVYERTVTLTVPEPGAVGAGVALGVLAALGARRRGPRR